MRQDNFSSRGLMHGQIVLSLTNEGIVRAHVVSVPGCHWTTLSSPHCILLHPRTTCCTSKEGTFPVSTPCPSISQNAIQMSPCIRQWTRENLLPRPSIQLRPLSCRRRIASQLLSRTPHCLLPSKLVLTLEPSIFIRMPIFLSGMRWRYSGLAECLIVRHLDLNPSSWDEDACRCRVQLLNRVRLYKIQFQGNPR